MRKCCLSPHIWIYCHTFLHKYLIVDHLHALNSCRYCIRQLFSATFFIFFVLYKLLPPTMCVCLFDCLPHINNNRTFNAAQVLLHVPLSAHVNRIYDNSICLARTLHIHAYLGICINFLWFVSHTYERTCMCACVLWVLLALNMIYTI